MLELLIPTGATPIEEVSGLRLQWIKTREQLNAAEANNILRATSKYFTNKQNPKKWLNEKTLRKIHYEMFSSVWDWAGSFYLGPKRNIGVDSFQIPILIRQLCLDIHYWLEKPSDLSPLEQSARIHHRLVQIHPFTNGNGRHARFIGDLYLHSLGGTNPEWPEGNLSQNSNVRSDYIHSLKMADIGDYSFLLALMEKHGGKD